MNSTSTSAGAFAAALFKWMRFQFIVVIAAEIKHRSFLLRLGGALAAAVVLAFFVAAVLLFSKSSSVGLFFFGAAARLLLLFLLPVLLLLLLFLLLVLTLRSFAFCFFSSGDDRRDATPQSAATSMEPSQKQSANSPRSFFRRAVSTLVQTQWRCHFSSRAICTSNGGSGRGGSSIGAGAIVRTVVGVVVVVAGGVIGSQSKQTSGCTSFHALHRHCIDASEWQNRVLLDRHGVVVLDCALFVVLLVPQKKPRKLAPHATTKICGSEPPVFRVTCGTYHAYHVFFEPLTMALTSFWRVWTNLLSLLIMVDPGELSVSTRARASSRRSLFNPELKATFLVRMTRFPSEELSHEFQAVRTRIPE